MALLVIASVLVGLSPKAAATPSIPTITLPVASIVVTGSSGGAGMSAMSSMSAATVSPTVDTNMALANLCDLDPVGSMNVTVPWSIVDNIVSSTTKSVDAIIEGDWFADPSGGGQPSIIHTSTSTSILYSVSSGGSYSNSGILRMAAPLHQGVKLGALSTSVAFKPDVTHAASMADKRATILAFDCHIPPIPGTGPVPGVGLNCYNYIPQTQVATTMSPTSTSNLASAGSTFTMLTVNLGSGCVLDALGTAPVPCSLVAALAPASAVNCIQTMNDIGNVLNSEAQWLAGEAGFGGDSADGAKGTATGAGDPTPVPSSHSLLLQTPAMDGKWTLSVVPSAVGVPGYGSLVSGLPAGAYATIPIPLTDHGHTTQPTDYMGTNPAPGQSPYIAQPPPTMKDIFFAGAACFAAGTTAFVTAVAIGAATGGVGTVGAGAVVTWFWSTVGAGAFCSDFYQKTKDAGKYGANGSYINTWGVTGNTEWNGHLFNLPGVLDITTHVEITDGKTIEAPYGNVDTTGHDAQKANYEHMDYEARKAAYGAHTQYREQTGGATASITVNAPIVGTVTGPILGAVTYLGSSYLGPVYYNPTIQAILVACTSVCSGNAVVTISSPGTGILTPGSQITLDFAGTPGAATINVLGLVGVTGFTLDGEFGGQSGGPASGVVVL